METAARLNPWLEAAAVAFRAKTDAVPEGWLTREQIMEQVGWTKNQAYDNLRIMRQEKTVETKTFKLMMDTGVVRLIPHYRVVRKTNKT